MGTLTGTYISEGAWIKANDTANIRWPSAEALRWINNGQREVVNQLPRANAKRAVPTLVASASRQDFAGLGITDGISVIDVKRNYLINGTTTGKPIRKAQQAWLDDNQDNWHASTGSEVKAWVYDDRDPKAFYVFPTVASGKVELIYAANPTDLATIGSTIALDDVYGNALEWFVLFSFYSKDAVYSKNPNVASGYWQLFMQSLGLRGQNLSGYDKQGDTRAQGSN